MKILARNRKIFYTDYEMVFHTLDGDRKFIFPCNECGEVDFDSMTMDEVHFFEECMLGTSNVSKPVVEEIAKSYVASAIGVCDLCSTQVVIDAARNMCAGCGSEYDFHGNSLDRLPLVS